MIDFTTIIEALLGLLAAIITMFLIPWLKSRTTVEQQTALNIAARTLVFAAEQIYGSKTGQQKKDYVVAFLLSKGIVIDIDEVTALIESEVYKLTDTRQSIE